MKTSLLKLTSLQERDISEGGFTLIEVLVALLIFVLVVCSFVSLFTGSYLAVNVAGERSQALSEIQGEAEHPGRAVEAKDTFVINFPGGAAVTAKGEIIPLEKTYGRGRKVTITYFIPYQ